MSTFRLKQFDIRQEQSALKVGTDGMLLGAWVADRFRDSAPRRILDVGTGTGIIALMLAQELPSSEVIGIELDPSSAREARHNAEQSPFAQRIRIVEGDFRTYKPTESIDLIVSNPPYYTPTHSNSDQRETVAKHAIELSADQFFRSCERATPIVAIIVAHSATDTYIDAAQDIGFHLTEQVDIVTKRGKAPQRQILLFSKSPIGLRQSQITILQGDGRHDYTEEYSQLLRPFLTIL